MGYSTNSMLGTRRWSVLCTNGPNRRQTRLSSYNWYALETRNLCNMKFCLFNYLLFSGHVGWGISWYINGLLIPEINVVRGRTYTFVVEGGNDPNTPARYHPFYITDDEVGGYEHKTDEEKAVSNTIISNICDKILLTFKFIYSERTNLRGSATFAIWKYRSNRYWTSLQLDTRPRRSVS